MEIDKMIKDIKYIQEKEPLFSSLDKISIYMMLSEKLIERGWDISEIVDNTSEIMKEVENLWKEASDGK